jgi:hypothetical protein
VSLLALAELSLVFAAVVGWAVYELYALRRDRRRAEAKAAEREPPGPDADRP